MRHRAGPAIVIVGSGDGSCYIATALNTRGTIQLPRHISDQTAHVIPVSGSRDGLADGPGCESTSPRSRGRRDVSHRSRDTLLSEAHKFVRSLERRGRHQRKRAQGRPKVRAAPAVSCAFDALEKCAHEHTGSAETLRPSLRNGLTAYTCSPWWPCCATISGVMRNHHRQLDASLGASGPHDFAVRTASLVL